MKIKTGDTVMVITGKDKGKSGKVLKAMPKENKVYVEGINMQTKHAKATRQLREGQLRKAISEKAPLKKIIVSECVFARFYGLYGIIAEALMKNRYT